MISLALTLLPIIATLGLTLAVSDTKLLLIKPTPEGLHLSPLPNPYPVPNTDITLDFQPQPLVRRLSPRKVVGLFDTATSEIEDHIRVHGDGPIEGNEYKLAVQRVEMALTSSGPPVDPLKNSEVLSVIVGISLKMAKEGYRNRAMEVLRTGNPATIGVAAVDRQTVARHTSA